MSNESKKPAARPDGNRTGAMRSWIIIATVVALFFAFYKTNPGEQAVRELTQIEFYKALDEGTKSTRTASPSPTRTETPCASGTACPSSRARTSP